MSADNFLDSHRSCVIVQGSCVPCTIYYNCGCKLHVLAPAENSYDEASVFAEMIGLQNVTGVIVGAFG